MPVAPRAVRPRTLPMLVAAALLAPLVALAQSSGPQSIREQMTTEQFRAAGLEKLSPAELAQLDAWLNRTLETTSQVAASEAKKRVVEDHRGFFNFGSTDPINGRIAGEFRGFGRGRSYTLENGQVWQQVDDASLAGVRKDAPSVTITPSIVGNAWYMAVQGYNTRAKVQRVK